MARATGSRTRTMDRDKPKVQQVQQPPVVTRDIVPGRFNDSDWNLMLDTDSNEEFIVDIVEELMCTVMDAIFKQYLENQLLPFTVTLARDALIEIIEWKFLQRDEGEENVSTDQLWTKDEEPQPLETDCWAQGAMPKDMVVILPKILMDTQKGSESESLTEASKLCEESQDNPTELPDVVSETEEPPQIYAEQTEVKPTEVTTVSSKQSKMRRQSRTRSLSLRKMTVETINDEIIESTERPLTQRNLPQPCSTFLKGQPGSITWTKDVALDDYGNVIAAVKIDSEKLPTHKVNVKFSVIDPTVEATQAKLDSKKKKASNKQKNKSLMNLDEPLSRGMKSKASVHQTFVGGPLGSTQKQKLSITSTMDLDAQRRSVIEEIEVSQGIIVRENGRVKKGPRLYHRMLDFLEESQKGMKPVNLKLFNPGITVADLLDRQTPIVRSFIGTPPLPPIVRLSRFS